MTAAIRAAFRAADVEQGYNFDTEITPLARRLYPWRITYESPDYANPLPSSAAEAKEHYRGLYISIEQAANVPEKAPDGVGARGRVGLRSVVYLSAWAAGDPRMRESNGDDLVIDGCLVHLDDLERFAAALSEMVVLARKRDAEATRRDRRSSS